MEELNRGAELLQLIASLKDSIKRLDDARKTHEDAIEELKMLKGIDSRNIEEVLSRVFKADQNRQLPYVLNGCNSTLCPRVFHEKEDKTPECCSAILEESGYRTCAPYRYPLECVWLWMKDSASPDTSLPDTRTLNDEQDIDAVKTEIRSQFIIPYTVCSSCWLHLSMTTRLKFPIKNKNGTHGTCLCCMSKKPMSSNRSVQLCEVCYAVEIIKSDRQYVLYTPALVLIESVLGITPVYGVLHCGTKQLDDVIEIGKKMCILIEKDTDGHASYDEATEFERMMNVLKEKSKSFRQVMMIRWNQNGPNLKKPIVSPIVSLLARQWALYAALRMVKRWGIVYIGYRENNKHMLKAMSELRVNTARISAVFGLPAEEKYGDDNVISVCGPPTHNDGKAVYALSPDEFVTMQKCESLKPYVVSWHS